MKFSIFSVFDNYSDQLNRSGKRLMEEVLEQTQFADKMGFHGAWYAEHHFSEYGILTSPQVFMAAAAERTKNIRLGIAIMVLPFHNPLSLAEDFALVDVLSNGRLNMGTGSGYIPYEFKGFNVDPTDKAFRFNEALEVIEKAWKGEKFSHKGKYYEYNDVQLVLTPEQEEVPIWIGALTKRGVEFVGKMGYNVMGFPYIASDSIQGVKEVVDTYVDSLKAAGHDESKKHLPLVLHTYVAETQEQAVADAKEHFNLYLRTREYGQDRKRLVYEDLERREQVLIGSPEHVIERIKKYQEIGMDEVLMCMNFGGMPHEKVLKSIELVSKEVMPAFETV